MDNRRTGNKHYDIAQVTDHQEEIARLLALGRSTEEICEITGLTHQTISNVRNHPIIVEMIRALHDSRNAQASDITQQIADVAPDAIALLKRVIRNEYNEEDDDNTLAAAPEVADQIRSSLGLLKTITPRLNINLHKHLITSESIEQIKQRAIEGAVKPEEVEHEIVEDTTA